MAIRHRSIAVTLPSPQTAVRPRFSARSREELWGKLLLLPTVLARVRGMYNLAGFQTGTVLLAGMAAMLVGCLGYLAAIAERGRT